MSAVVAEEYASSLSDLTVNSKPLINMLTILAEENIDHAPAIVQAVEKHLQTVQSDIKLPVLYLIDSIVKNVGRAYIPLFTQNIVSSFCSVFEKVDERTRLQMYKLRQTWNDVFNAKKLYAVDVRVHSIDPAWPITAPVPTSIHVNPKFFKTQTPPTATTTAAVTVPSVPLELDNLSCQPAVNDVMMRDELLRKQKELIELQQKKLELELMQTKAKLEEQQKQLDRQTGNVQVKQAQQLLQPAVGTAMTVEKIIDTTIPVVPSSVLLQGQQSSTDLSTPPVTASSQTHGLVKPAIRTRDPRLAARAAPTTLPSTHQEKSEIIFDSLHKADTKLECLDKNIVQYKEPKGMNKPKVRNSSKSSSPTSTVKSEDVSKPKSSSPSSPIMKRIPKLKSSSKSTKSDVTNSVLDISKDKEYKDNSLSRILSPVAKGSSPRKKKVFSGEKEKSVLIEKEKVNDKEKAVNDIEKCISEKEKIVEKDKSINDRDKTVIDKDRGSVNRDRVASPKKKPGCKSSETNSRIDEGKSPVKSKNRSRDQSKCMFDAYSPFVHSDGDSPSPPPPPIISDNKKEEDRGKFKDVKMSGKRRNYVRRNRDESRSRSRSPVKSDVDLRLSGPPDKQQKLMPSVNLIQKAPVDAAIVTVITDATKDVDLRLLPGPGSRSSPGRKRPSAERELLDQPPVKKSKAEMFDVLFGNEDVDLRQLPPMPLSQPTAHPSPPPPPIISHPSPTSKSEEDVSSPSREDGKKSTIKEKSSDGHIKGNGELDHRDWAKFKGPTTPSPHRNRPWHKMPHNKFDRLGRPVLYSKIENTRRRTIFSSLHNEDTDMRMYLNSEDSLDDVNVNIGIIVSQADEQLKSGKLSFAQYNTLLRQVIHLNEKNKLREAQRRDFSSKQNIQNQHMDLSPVSEDGSIGDRSATYSPRHDIDDSEQGHSDRRYGDIDERFAPSQNSRRGGRPWRGMSSRADRTCRNLRTVAPPISRSSVTVGPDLLSRSEIQGGLEMSSRADASRRPDVSGSLDLPNRPDLIARPDVISRSDIVGRPDMTGRPDMKGRPDILGRPDITNRLDMPGRLETGRPDLAGTGRPDIPGRLDVVGRLDMSVRPDMSGRPDMVGRPDMSGRPDMACRPDMVGRPDIIARPDMTGIPDMSVRPELAVRPEIMPVRPDLPIRHDLLIQPIRSRGPGHLLNRPDGLGSGLLPGPPGPGVSSNYWERPPWHHGPSGLRPMHPQPFLRPPGADIRWRPPPHQPFGSRQPNVPSFEPRFERVGQRAERFERRVGPVVQPPSADKEEFPPADPLILEQIATDSMKTINIDGIPREIRYYGDTAIVLLAWDDPREIGFQGGDSKRIIIDDVHQIVCHFNSGYRDCIIDGQLHKIKLGAPTRELYIDGKWYECFFGGAPINVEIDGKLHSFKLEGPPPQAKIGTTKRMDLCAGKINLIIDAREMIAVFLDAKPQRFDIENKPHILRFVNALSKVLINGQPFDVEFGGLPKPINVNGKRHFIRFSVLPQQVKPGYITIQNMDGGRLPSPPPKPDSQETKESKQQSIAPSVGDSSIVQNVDESTHDSDPRSASPFVYEDDDNEEVMPVTGVYIKRKAGALEMLTSLMPPVMAPSSGFGYQIDHDSTSQDGLLKPQEVTVPPATEPPAPISALSFLPANINVDELFQKLVATGIVRAKVDTPESGTQLATDEEKKQEDSLVKHVNLGDIEGLKVLQPGMVSKLYAGIQCNSCGTRFLPEQTTRYSQHLDWHFRQNRRERDNNKLGLSRKWYYDINDWTQYEEIEDLEQRAQSWFEAEQLALEGTEEAEPIEVPSAPISTSNESAVCVMCHDAFEQFYNEENEEWHFKMAIRVDEKLYHPMCYEDYKLSLSFSSTEEIHIDFKDETKDESMEDPDIQEIIVTKEVEVREEIEIDDDDDDDEDEVPTTLLSNEVLSVKDEETIESEANEVASGVIDIILEAVTSRVGLAKVKEEYISDDEVSITEPIIEEKNDEEELTTVLPTADTTHTEVVSSIDGNVQFEDKPAVTVATTTGKIKINISKALTSRDTLLAVEETDTEATIEQDIDSESEPVPMRTVPDESEEPPPPGVDVVPDHLLPAQLKPRLIGRNLTVLPTVMKGSELSGLCSIM